MPEGRGFFFLPCTPVYLQNNVAPLILDYEVIYIPSGHSRAQAVNSLLHLTLTEL